MSKLEVSARVTIRNGKPEGFKQHAAVCIRQTKDKDTNTIRYDLFLSRFVPGPHWGCVLRGQLTTTDADGAQETVSANDLFYRPPGHNVKVDADAEIII